MDDINNLSVDNLTALTDDLHFDNFTLAPLGENTSFEFKYGNNEFSVSSEILEDGSELLTQVFKFDNYFLYSYDTNA